jgi:hypothetical protein
MGPCAQLCQLRPEFVDLSLDDQLAMLRGCHEANAAAYAACWTDKRRLEDWIRAAPP